MATSAFVKALVRFAGETDENLQAVKNLQSRAIQEVLQTPDGALVTQVGGTLNGKSFQFFVDRKLSELIGDLEETMSIIDGTAVRATYVDFSGIQL